LLKDAILSLNKRELFEGGEEEKEKVELND